MEMYLNENQKVVINAIDDFIKEHKHIVVSDKDYSKELLFQKVNEIISRELKAATGLNIEVHQYFDGKRLSKTKMEVINMDTKEGTSVFINLKRKKVNKETVRVKDDTFSSMTQYINGEAKEIKIKYSGIVDIETWDYTLSYNYDILRLIWLLFCLTFWQEMISVW